MSHNKPGPVPSRPLSDLAFFASAPHDCGYLPGKRMTTVFADPDAPMDVSTYSALAEIGFRRSGPHVYTPHCSDCRACLPARLPVAHFQPNRNQRRVQKAAARVTAVITNPVYRDEHFALYQRYIASRHAGGGMDDPSPEKYLEFLTCPWSQTEFVEFRHQDQLVAVAVQDVLTRGLSSVYTFFDPGFTGISLGRLALLWQIAETQRRGLAWLFLGYWIGNCQKMSYKQEYRPIELFQNGQWQRYDHDQELPNSDLAAG